MGVSKGVNPNNVAEAGWGVIFAAADPNVPEIQEALKPLLDLRREQAQADGNEHYYQQYLYHAGESKQDFLVGHGVGTGSANPERLPYYLLIVGDPETIPFEFQYHLDVQYAVGRLHFDTVEEYANYAHSVVRAETGSASLPRRVTFFNPINQDDLATRLVNQHLVSPLVAQVRERHPEWEVQLLAENEATKPALATIIKKPDVPALLFVAAHGIRFPKGDPRQLAHQGALLCQEWPGSREWRETIPPDFFFSADDVPSDASLHGLIAFFFAEYGAATPQVEDFARHYGREPQEIAPHSFIARLPQRLLSHPGGGALAVIGHVDINWATSFKPLRGHSSTGIFDSLLVSLLKQLPVGAAIEAFNEQYVVRITEYAATREEVEFGRVVDEQKLAWLRTAAIDLRN